MTTRPSEAVEYAKTNRIALAFLDIEMGQRPAYNREGRLQLQQTD